MALTWWPVVAVGLVGLAAVLLAAVLAPTTRPRGRYPLANTARLTGLPEYRAVLRAQTRSAVVALVLLGLLFAAAVLATARPTRPAGAESAPREDIMLCVSQPVTDPATGAFLGYFARQAVGFGTERIGLTSVNRRVIPLTRDHQFAAARLGDYTRPDTRAELAETFAPPVEYRDYAPTVADVLALCLTGFPGFEQPGSTRRQVIYLGPGALRAPGDDRPSLFTEAQVVEMARRAGAHIDAVATPGRETEELTRLTEGTGGRFVRYDAAELTRQLDTFRTATPPGYRERRDEDPAIPLVTALAVAGLLSVALMAVRR